MTVIMNSEPNEQSTETLQAKLIKALLAIGEQQTLNAGNLLLQIQKLPLESGKKRGCFKNSEPIAPE